MRAKWAGASRAPAAANASSFRPCVTHCLAVRANKAEDSAMRRVFLRADDRAHWCVAESELLSRSSFAAVPHVKAKEVR